MRKALSIVGALALIVALLLVVADRVGAHYAERAIAEKVAARLAANKVQSAEPEVTVTGFPFLTQVLRGNYDEIQVDLRDVKVGALAIPLLEVRAYDVRATVKGIREGNEKIIATRVDGKATLSYAALVEASGLQDVTLSGDGSVLRITGTIPVAGELRGAARVTVVDGRVRIQVTELTAANASAATQQLLDRYRQRLGAATFSLPPMPFQLKLTGVNPGVGGLEISMSANEVELN